MPLLLVRSFASLILVLIFIFFQPSPAAAFHYQNSESGADYMLIGVGVLRQNITKVDGDPISFKDSDDGLPSDYSNL